MSNPNIAKDSPKTWKPGQSGNPNGRPPLAWTWAGLVREAMEEMAEDGEPIKKKVSKSLVLKALQGDVQAIKEIGDRLDGKPQQKTDITSGGEKIQVPIMGGTADVLKNNSIPETLESK